jgi:hypothetical protein
MIPLITLSYTFRLVFLFLLFTDLSNHPVSSESKKDSGFVVVELFTSEGCSSCPSADAAIIELSKKFNDNVYFLGYHVDYWDYLGWKDEYSSRTFTRRQEQYADVFSLNSIYTPQVIVNGKKEFVGSDKNKLEQTIIDELKNKPGTSIELNAKRGDKTIVVNFKTTGLDNTQALNIALVQLAATTFVKKGENRGRELHHINIVRELKTVNSNDSSVSFTLPANGEAKDLKIVAFVQNKNNLNINGAAETYLAN